MFEIFGWISALCFLSGYIPQIVKTFRLKTVEDMSLGLWVLTVIAYLSGFIYGTFLGKWPLIFNYGMGLMLSSIILGQYYLYYDRRKAAIRKVVKDTLRDLRNK